MATVASSLSATEAVPLAHALAQYVAAAENIRILSIKGPVVNAQGLRQNRVSSDADVLIDPRDFERFCDALRLRGWERRFARDVPRTVEQHSFSFIHENWPVDIDVHHYYPGCLIEEQDSFERLWERRVTMEIAGRDLTVTDEAGSTMIVALHAARQPRSSRHIDEREHLIAVVNARGTMPTELAMEVAELAAACGAVGPLAEFLRSVGIRVEGTGFRTEKERLRWIYSTETNDDGAAGSWFLAIKEAPLLRKPVVLWRAVYPSNAELANGLLTAHLDAQGRRRFRWDRFRRGVYGARHALSVWRRLR